MNRKQRRASLRSQSPARAVASGSSPKQLFAEAMQYQQQHRLDDAARAYRSLLVLRPEHAEAHNNLGFVLQLQGKLSEASAHFARALLLMPQFLDQTEAVHKTLLNVLPQVGDIAQRAAAAWPNRRAIDPLFGSPELDAIATDPLLAWLLQAAPVRQLPLERLFTSLRYALLMRNADAPTSSDHLAFCCVLAKQCFINEYVFATTSEEEAAVARLKATLADAIASGDDIAPMQLAALAMYLPLNTLPDAEKLLSRNWPASVDEVLTQQLREPLQEHKLRDLIPRLTPIDDAVSLRVRKQYEDNPYPRWMHVAGNVEAKSLNQHLRDIFPTIPFALLPQTGVLDVLIAGSGTGWQAIGVTQKFEGARVLAVDLSLTSLSYAMRKTPAALSPRIEFAQADILNLGAIDRRFDLIEASGVLHHMADLFAGWRVLCALLKPAGFMHIGLYSEIARRDVVAARSFIAERGYGATPAEIWRCRQELIDTPINSVTRFNDFYTISECRDLLFHVQETRVSIPAIKNFILQNGLRFLGFEFDAASMRKYRALFAEKGWSLTDLDRWHALEMEYPDTFANMYQLWLQKA